METRFDTCRVLLVQGDITAQKVDAIVNAANSGLRGGGGVDGAIHRAGGPSIMAECHRLRARQGGCPTGQAVATTAGNLEARWVIHTVGPVWRGGGQGEADLLASAYRNSMALAMEIGAMSVAFPSISTGVYGYPIEKACRVALTAVREACAGAGLVEVRFVLFSKGDHRVYQEALSDMEADP